MQTRRNVITLNGNRYDAKTGELLSTKKPIIRSDSKTYNKPVNSSLDGFNKSNYIKKPVIRKSPSKLSRPTHKSKTLVRRVVTKPKSSVQSSQKSPKIEKPIITNPARELRAKSTHKSKLISKFGFASKPNSTKYQNLPLATPQSKTSLVQSAPKPSLQTINKATPTAVATPNNPRQTSNILERAINNSVSHESKKSKKTSRTKKLAKKLNVKPSFLNISLFLLGFIILGSYFAYNNVPNISMKLASSRAGVNGSIPSYQAGGFSFNGPIEYKSGQIVIKYQSNSDDRNYSIIQSKSEWNNDTLLANYISKNDKNYQVFQDKGKTIYIYDNDSASWVENGVWYEIDGNSSLTANQVIKIANSL